MHQSIFIDDVFIIEDLILIIANLHINFLLPLSFGK